MFKMSCLQDTGSREYRKRNHGNDIGIDLEQALSHPKDDCKSECNPNYIFLERSSLDRSTFNLEFDRLGLERIELHKKEPRENEHYYYVRHHPYHPAHESDIITGILKSTKRNGIRRCTDWSTHTTQVCRNRNGERQRNTSASVFRQCCKNRSKECQHHRSSRRVTHEH